MNKKRFTIEKSENQDTIYDWEGIDDYYHLGNDTRDVNNLCDMLNDFNEENISLKKEVYDYKTKCSELERTLKSIKTNLLNYIIDYDKISHDNYYYGLSESVEDIAEEIRELFENPLSWKPEFICSDCKYCKEDEDDVGGICLKQFNKKIEDIYNVCDCEVFEWKI